VEIILQDLEKALEARFYYLAIAAALMVIDACGALESDEGRASKERFARWYKGNLGSAFQDLSGEDCYFLRSAVLHQCRFDNHRYTGRFTRVIFSLPTNNASSHNNLSYGALVLDAETFCRQILNAARRWYAANQGNENVKKNLPALVQYRPEGLARYTMILGLPVIA
jgi:hypothetical protein